MNKLPFYLVLTIIPFFFMGCKEINLTINDSGKTITVSKGTMIKAELVSNRSTGYDWRKIDYDNKILELSPEPVYEKNNNGLTGAPGKVIYTFKAKAPGKTTLNMEYGSVADKEKAATKKFTVNIVVN